VTAMLTLSIETELFERFPALRVGAFLAARLDLAMAAMSEAELHRLVAEASAALAQSGITADNAARVPAIQQWRQAFAACGLQPATYRGSVEALVHKLLENDRVADRVPAVTLSCAISARHLAPLAGHDVDALPTTAVRLRSARPQSDWFVPLGARPNDIPANPSVVVYAAGQTVLCWAFNHRDSRQTSLRAATRRAVFFSEAVDRQQAAAAEEALQDLRQALARLGAKVSAPIFADTTTPDVALRFS
jgi:DNA/RNA-binding domain of Phe-tRNA-synthetase-like protein